MLIVINNDDDDDTIQNCFMNFTVSNPDQCYDNSNIFSFSWTGGCKVIELEYGTNPFFHIKVSLTHPPNDKPDVLPLWELDDGIIEGALLSRYPEDSNVIVRKEPEEDDKDSWRYTLIFVDDVEEDEN